MLVSLIVLSTAIVMILIEVLRPGRAWPDVAGWWLRAALLNGVQAAMVFIAGGLWDGWMLQNRPWSADGLGTTSGAILATWPLRLSTTGGIVGGMKSRFYGVGFIRSIIVRQCLKRWRDMPYVARHLCSRNWELIQRQLLVGSVFVWSHYPERVWEPCHVFWRHPVHEERSR